MVDLSRALATQSFLRRCLEVAVYREFCQWAGSSARETGPGQGAENHGLMAH